MGMLCSQKKKLVLPVLDQCDNPFAIPFFWAFFFYMVVFPVTPAFRIVMVPNQFESNDSTKSNSWLDISSRMTPLGHVLALNWRTWCEIVAFSVLQKFSPWNLAIIPDKGEKEWDRNRAWCSTFVLSIELAYINLKTVLYISEWASPHTYKSGCHLMDKAKPKDDNAKSKGLSKTKHKLKKPPTSDNTRCGNGKSNDDSTIPLFSLRSRFFHLLT